MSIFCLTNTRESFDLSSLQNFTALQAAAAELLQDYHIFLAKTVRK